MSRTREDVVDMQRSKGITLKDVGEPERDREKREMEIEMEIDHGDGDEGEGEREYWRQRAEERKGRG